MWVLPVFPFLPKLEAGFSWPQGRSPIRGRFWTPPEGRSPIPSTFCWGFARIFWNFFSNFCVFQKVPNVDVETGVNFVYDFFLVLGCSPTFSACPGQAFSSTFGIVRVHRDLRRDIWPSQGSDFGRRGGRDRCRAEAGQTSRRSRTSSSDFPRSCRSSTRSSG